jgi:hypothetical protein
MAQDRASTTNYYPRSREAGFRGPGQDPEQLDRDSPALSVLSRPAVIAWTEWELAEGDLTPEQARHTLKQVRGVLRSSLTNWDPCQMGAAGLDARGRPPRAPGASWCGGSARGLAVGAEGASGPVERYWRHPVIPAAGRIPGLVRMCDDRSGGSALDYVPPHSSRSLGLWRRTPKIRGPLPTRAKHTRTRRTFLCLTREGRPQVVHRQRCST